MNLQFKSWGEICFHHGMNANLMGEVNPPKWMNVDEIVLWKKGFDYMEHRVVSR